MKKTFTVLSLLLLTFFITPSNVSAFDFTIKFPPSFYNLFNFPKPTPHPIPFPSIKPSIKPSPTPTQTPTPTPTPKPVDKELKVKGSYSKVKNTVNLEFSNLDQIKFIGLFLSYKSNGVDQGIVDSIFTNGAKKVTKDIFLGTCSTGICVPHKNATNIQLKIDGYYNNNQTFSKTLDIN